jgi:glc operon protein GlcG
MITWSRPSLTLDAAMRVLHSAILSAQDRNLVDSVVVVDETGQVKASARMDGASAFTFQAATDKAFTSANTGAPTSMWDSVIAGNAHDAVRLTSAIERLNILPGGVPIVFDGVVVGAVGVSGGTDDQDLAIAESAVAVLGDQT